MRNESTIEVPTVVEEALALAGRLNLELMGLIEAKKASNRRTTKIGKAIETKTEDLSRVVQQVSGVFPGEEGAYPLFDGQNEADRTIGGQDGHDPKATEAQEKLAASPE